MPFYLCNQKSVRYTIPSIKLDWSQFHLLSHIQVVSCLRFNQQQGQVLDRKFPQDLAQIMNAYLSPDETSDTACRWRPECSRAVPTLGLCTLPISSPSSAVPLNPENSTLPPTKVSSPRQQFKVTSASSVCGTSRCRVAPLLPRGLAEYPATYPCLQSNIGDDSSPPAVSSTSFSVVANRWRDMGWMNKWKSRSVIQPSPIVSKSIGRRPNCR